jgi:hypothetical protein
VAGTAIDLGHGVAHAATLSLDLWTRRPPRGLGVAAQATRVARVATLVHHMVGRPKHWSSDGGMSFFFSDSSAGVTMNQVGGGLDMGIKSGRWERRMLGGARWAAWACRSRLNWRRHCLRGAIFVIRCFC